MFREYLEIRGVCGEDDRKMAAVYCQGVGKIRLQVETCNILDRYLFELTGVMNA